MSFSPLYTENTSPFDKDLATFSNYTENTTTHIDLEWAVDWSKQVIGGSCALRMEVTAEEVNEVVLDVSYLDLKKVEIEGKEAVRAQRAML